MTLSHLTRDAGGRAAVSQPMAGFRGSRFAGFSGSSYNADTRSVEAVLSAGSAVRRAFFTEELTISADAVDLGRAKSGLVPLLAAHNQFDLNAVLGTVSNVRVANGQLLGTLTFGDTDQARQVEGMVARGELRGVSIGYTVNTWQIQSRVDGDAPETWRATDWELQEVSIVPVPADALSGIRSSGSALTDLTQEELEMLTRNAPSGAATPAAGANVTRFSATQSMDFIRMAREFGVEMRAEELVRLNDAGSIGTEAARDALMQAAAERQRAQTARVSAAGVTERGGETFDNPAFFGRAVADAIYSRLSGAEPTEQARQFRNLSLVALMSEGLARAGVTDVRHMSPTEIAHAAFTRGGYHTTSDFPSFLTDGVNRHIIGQFAAAAAAIKIVSRERSAADFRQVSGLQLSGFGTLPQYNEAGEIKHGTFQERKETYQVKTFAKMFALSREAIVNDDLGAFAQAATIMARAAAETEAQIFANLINSNPVMGDGKAVFHAGHGNLATSGAAPSVTTLDAGRIAMRSQMDYDGETPLAAAPAYILASPKRETAIEQLLVATINPTQAAETNPFHGKLTPLIDPRLSDDAWYLFAEPALVPVLEHAYLHGKAGPTVEMQPGWNTLGQEFRVFMDFGAGLVDARGAYKNPGA